MAGTAKFELSSVSPEDLGFAGSIANGTRGAHLGASLNRFGSFRESSNGRSFSSGAVMSKGKISDLPPLSQWLILEPFITGDQKYSRSTELKRALGFSFGNISDDNFFGAAHSKTTPTLSIDELKRFRGTVLDGNDKARTRVKRLDDNLNKLTGYLRKVQIIERFSAPNFLKTGAQYNVKAPDSVMHKDDRIKNVLSKRARTPVADMRVEGRGTGIPRQHMVLGKDRDIKQGSLSSDSVEEKMRTLPAGGETWDRKMKRKRSVSNGFPRPVDGEGMHGRVSSDTGMLYSDALAFRISSNSSAGYTKSDGSLSASVSSICQTPKSEMEKLSFTRELGGMNKERILQKGNNKLNVRDGSHLVNPSLISKGKATRGSRAGPLMMGNTSPTLSHMASTPEDWESSNVSKIDPMGGNNNHKRAVSSESSSPPMTQWVGQRPQKVSRIRKTDIISPTSNNDEAIITSEGCTSGGFNGTHPARSMASSILQIKVKVDSTSPARSYEVDEISAAENRAVGSFETEERAKNVCLHGGSPRLLTKKTKLLVKEEIGDGVRRLGRNGRGSSFSRGSISPLGRELDSPATAKPASDKNGSKSGRPPLKKHSEHKGRLSLAPNGNFPDRTGKSDNDREDLLAAAQFTSNANYHACSSSFWKNMEPLFSITNDDMSYLIQQLKALKVHQGSSSEMFISDNDMKDALREEKHHQLRSFGSEGEKPVLSYGFEPTMSEPLVKQGQDSDFCKGDSEEGHNGMTSLYQRVLSALIIEDEYEGLDQNTCEGDPLLYSGREDSRSMEDVIFCNGDTLTGKSSIEVPSQAGLLKGDYNFMKSKAGVLPASSQGNLNRLHTSSQGHYALMSMDEKLQAELQSIGLHPKTVNHDLAEGEDEVFSEEILQLKKQYHWEVNKKKSHLEKIWKAVEVEKELRQWELEQVAVNRLVVLAYKKLLATRVNTASKIGVSKIPRNVALAFVKRTLARCRKFEDTGKSCFSEPPLWDVILAGPSSNSNNGLKDHKLQPEAKAQGSNPTATEQLGLHDVKPERVLFGSSDPLSHQPDHPYAKNAPILNRGKKRELMLDDVGNGFKSPLGNTPMGEVKGKRSDRDRDKESPAKSSRPSVTNSRGERKAKSKPKQRANQSSSSTHPVFPSNGSIRKRVNGGNILDSSKDPADMTNFPVDELDPIQLGVESELAEHQDLGSWLNFDDDSLQDHDSMGLEIPMDDLSDLNMLI
ncbi:hypothetical protein V2J09_001194 [Rumex salicifolius]